ncbi:MAG: TRAP transporter fused permease subunit [Pseudomonadota bacterium]
MAFLLVALPLIAAVDPTGLFRLYILPEQFLLTELTMALCLVLWKDSTGDGVSGAGTLNWWLGVTALATGGWAIIRYTDFGYGFASYWQEPVMLAVILVGFTLEATRRYAGWPMMILVLAFILFGYFGQYFSGWFSIPAVSASGYATYLVFDGDALIGKALAIMAGIVTVFVLLGKLFELAGAADFIKDLALKLTNSSRGAPIKVSVLASGLIGSIIGSTTSNIMTSGHFSFPMMKRMGLRPSESAAIEAVASTGGQLTPPVMGFAAFLIIDIAGISYGTLIAATLLPSILFYFSLFVQADRLAAQKGFHETEVVETTFQQLAKSAVPIVSIFATIILCLWLNPFAPQWAAAMGVGVASLFALVRLMKAENRLKQLMNAMVSAGNAAAGVVAIGAAIGVVLGVINSTGLGVTLAIAVSNAVAGSLLFGLLVAALASFVLGTGLSTAGVYVIVGTVIAPTLVDLGISPIAAHLFVFYTAMLSMITPPVAIACVVASGMAGAKFLPTSLHAVQFGWIKFFLPFLFVYSPELLLQDGTYFQSVATFSAMMVAIVLFGNAMSGFEREAISIGMRIAYGILAALLLFPILDHPAKLAITVLLIVWINRDKFLRQAPLGE